MRKIALQFARDGFEKVHEIKPDDVPENIWVLPNILVTNIKAITMQV